MDRRVLLLFAFLAGLALVLWMRRQSTPPEQAVSAVIDEMIVAAEAHDASGVMAHIAESFEHPDVTRAQARTMLHFQLRRAAWASVVVVDRELSYDGDGVDAELTAVLMREDADDEDAGLAEFLPDALGAYSFELRFEETDGDWMVVSARWRRLSLGVR